MFPNTPGCCAAVRYLIEACEFHKCFLFLFVKYESSDSHRTVSGRSVGSPSEAETTLNNRSVDQFLRAIQSLDYYSRHTLVPIWTSVPLHQMIVEERFVRLHAVIDCLGLISQGGASDGPICHRESETEGWHVIICWLEGNSALPATHFSFSFTIPSRQLYGRLYYMWINGVVVVIFEIVVSFQSRWQSRIEFF